MSTIYLAYSDNNEFIMAAKASSESEALDKMQKLLGLDDEAFARDELTVIELEVIE